MITLYHKLYLEYERTPTTTMRRTVVLFKTRAVWDRLELLGRSQNWLARETGISRGYLSTLVNEARAPSGRIRRRMQTVLGIEDFDELFELRHEDDDA